MIITTRHKDCARCDEAAQFAKNLVETTELTEAKHHIEAGSAKHWGHAAQGPAKPFNFAFDAVTGIYMVEALREKARKERQEASAHITNAGITVGAESDFHALKMTQATNRAKLLEDAAAEIKKTVHEELVRNFDAAFERMGE